MARPRSHTTISAAFAGPRLPRWGLLELIVETLDGLAKHGDEGNAAVEESVKGRVHELTRRFPIYG